MEPFNLTYNDHLYRIIPDVHEEDPDMSTFIIMRDGRETCTVHQNEDHVTWGVCKGEISEDELHYITDRIESMYM